MAIMSNYSLSIQYRAEEIIKPSLMPNSSYIRECWIPWETVDGYLRVHS